MPLQRAGAEFVPEKSLTKRFAFLFVAILFVKGGLFLVDSRPELFLGDSASYLSTAVSGWIPDDRSFVYGFFLRAVAFSPHSLTAMVIVQSTLSGITAWLVAVYLFRFLDTRFSIAAAASLLCAIEPLQLLSERFVMTEALAGFLFALYFGCCLDYLRSGKLRMLLVSQLLAVLLISVRLSFLPLVLANSVLLPVLSPDGVTLVRRLVARLRKSTVPERQVAIVPLVTHLLVAVVLLQMLLLGYRSCYGSLARKPPAYLYADGFFLLADVSPIIEPEDYPLPSRRAAVFLGLKYDRKDPLNRQVERWWPGGLVDQVIQQAKDENGRIDIYAANQMAKRTAIHGMMRDPLGVFWLSSWTLRDYFRLSRLKLALSTDEGAGQNLSADLQESLRLNFGAKLPPTFTPSLMDEYHLGAVTWYLFIICFLAASPLFVCIVRRNRRPVAMFCVAVSLFFMEGAIVLVERPTPRYLTSAAWLVILIGGSAAEILVSKLRARTD